MKGQDQFTGDQDSPSLTGEWRLLGSACLAAVLWLQWRYFALSLRNPVLHRDEANDIFTALQSWPDLLRHFATDWVPFVYLLALKIWMGLLGSGEIAVRSLSLISTWGACLVLYRALRNWWGHLAAAAGVTMLGLSAVVLQYPVVDFARPYAMALLCSCWTFERFVALTRAPVLRNWIWFGLAAALAANIQPVNLGFLATLPVGAWVLELRRNGRVAGTWSRPLRIAALLLLVSLPTVVQAVRFREGQGDERADLSGGVARYYAGHAMRMAGWVAPWIQGAANYAADDDLAGLPRNLAHQTPPDVLLLSLAVVVAAAWLVATRRRWTGEDLVALCMAAGCVLYLLTAGIGNARMMVSWKCYSGLAVGVATATAAVIRPSRALLAILALATIMRAGAAYGSVARSKTGQLSDAKDAAAYIAAGEQEGDLVVLANLVLSPTFSYYYQGHSRQWHHPYDGPLKVWHATRLWRHVGEPWRVTRTVDAVREAAARGQRIWLVTGDVDEARHPPERWHRWYSPDAHMALMDVLGATCRLSESRSFHATAESYRVTLYLPPQSQAGDRP